MWYHKKKMIILQKSNSVMKDCDINDTRFKIAAMNKLTKIHENLEWQFYELRNKINEKKSILSKR